MASAVDDFQHALELFSAGRLPEAAAVCRRVLSAEPGHARALHMLGRVLLEERELEEARNCLERARELDPHNPGVLAACGRLHLYGGQFDEAVAALNQALAQDPDHVEAHHCLALALQNLGRLEEAEKHARTALGLRPKVAEFLDSLGVILVRRGQHAEAQRYFEEALTVAPDNPAAIWQLALWDEQTNRVAEAEQLVQRGLGLYPKDPALRFVLARCQRRRREFDAARITLLGIGDVSAPALRKDVEYELALCCDALQQADEAMEHASRANSVVREFWPRSWREGRDYLTFVQDLRRRFTPEWVASWSSLPVDGSSRPPVFLVGFPRSGTTLLDTMLGVHPDLRVLEEQPTLQAVVKLAERLPGGYPNALADLSAADRKSLQAAYYDAVPVTDRTAAACILDKNPLGSVHLGLIQRVFPDAPVLFMLRHPCDVVLSCCMTNFDHNPGTANFLELSTTVEFYCQVMELWKTYRQVLQPKFKEVRYEDLVTQPEKTLRDALSFAGLPWSPQVLSHVEHAMARGRIISASYAQVTEPLHDRARGRWRRYTRYLEPYFHQLRPWCEAFGYEL